LTDYVRRVVVAAALMAAGSGEAAAAVTFADIAPTVYSRCSPCHHSGGDAPFSLTTFEEVRRRSRQIAEVTRSGYMPPWKPSPASGPFLGDRRLTPAEIARFQQWADDGALRGDRTPAPPTFNSAWLHGPPDLVLALPAYTLRSDGPDVFRNFVVAIPGSTARYVRGFQFRPGNRAVHHANIRIDPTSASRLLDDADPQAGYEGLILNSAEYPDGQFLGWTPGQAPPPGSPDAEWRLPPGGDFVVQLHMQPTGKEEIVQPTIGLYFTDQPPTSTPVMLRLGRQNIDIRAGDSRHRVTDSFVLPVDASVLAIQPHAHFRAREVTAVARFADGVRRTLIHIADWDFRWQDQYRFTDPVRLPAGTSLDIEVIFDNSPANPRNPDRPPQRVEWGWRSSDEMADVWMQFQARTDADRFRLGAVARRKMAAEQAVGSEVLVTRNPDYVALRNDAAVTYLELGRPEDALRHFAAVVQLSPASAVARYNEGVALEALGRRAEAADRYRRAIEIDPLYSAAHNNLGGMLAIDGRVDEAVARFREAIRLDARNAEARCGLARALTISRRAADAVVEFKTAVTLRPDWPACLVPYAWLLAAHSSPAIRRPSEAVAVARRAVVLTGNEDAAALDALAVAFASDGQFEAAVDAGERAIALAARGRSLVMADAVRERVALYRQRKPFVVPE
jgi:Flp pilus assembly protein TadD